MNMKERHFELKLISSSVPDPKRFDTGPRIHSWVRIRIDPDPAVLSGDRIDPVPTLFFSGLMSFGVRIQ